MQLSISVCSAAERKLVLVFVILQILRDWCKQEDSRGGGIEVAELISWPSRAVDTV